MTVLPNKENTVESLRRNFRSLAANSGPHPRYSDTEEIQIARIGSVHAAYPLFPLYPSDTRRERLDTGRDGGVSIASVGASREWGGLIQG